MRRTVLFSLLTEGLKIRSLFEVFQHLSGLIRGKTAERAGYLLIVSVVKCETCLKPSRTSSVATWHFVQRAFKKTCLRAGREDNRGATRRRGRLFSSQQCLDQVWGAPRHLQGALSLCAGGPLTFVRRWRIRLEFCPYSSVHLYGTALG